MPPEIRPTPTPRWLSWLAAGAGVTAAHLLLLWAIPGSPLSDRTGQAAVSEVVTIGLLPPAALAPTPADAARPAPDGGPGTGAAAGLPETASTDSRSVDAIGLAGAGTHQGPEHEDAAGPAADKAQAPARMMAAPASVRLLYALTGQSKGLHFSADAALDWQQDGHAYLARMELSAFLVGSRSQTSSGRIGSEGLQPERFSDRARRDRTTLLDHAAGLVRQEPGGYTLQMPSGTQDRLSVFLQLALLMSGLQQAPEPGDSWTIPVAASRAIEPWTFHWRGREELALPQGRIMSWHLGRQALQAGETQVDIWLAPELGYLPARLRLQQENGDIIDQRLLRH